MKRADSRNAGHEPNDCASVQSLLQDLNAEAKSLPPEIVDRLAAARHQAIMHSQGHPVSSVHQTGRSICEQHGGKVHQPSDRTGGRSLQHYLETLLHARPLTASLATCAVAALAATLVFSTAEPEIDQSERVAMVTPESEPATSTVSVDAGDASVKASSFDALSSEQVPVMASEDSLELVGSVDFLLWLDSQQS